MYFRSFAPGGVGFISSQRIPGSPHSSLSMLCAACAIAYTASTATQTRNQVGCALPCDGSRENTPGTTVYYPNAMRLIYWGGNLFSTGSYRAIVIAIRSVFPVSKLPFSPGRGGCPASLLPSESFFFFFFFKSFPKVDITFCLCFSNCYSLRSRSGFLPVRSLYFCTVTSPLSGSF